MLEKNDCHCGCGCEKCSGVLERPRYFGGQVITAAELVLEHNYLRDKFRRINRMIHGWGVVCGACIEGVRQSYDLEPWKVRVTPGYLLAPTGDEIVIDCPRVIDLRGPGIRCACGSTDSLHSLEDDCCDDFRRDYPRTVYVAVRYHEIECRPVRTAQVCDCDGSRCEYSRWRDGYEIAPRLECRCVPERADQERHELRDHEQAVGDLRVVHCGPDWGITVPDPFAHPRCPPCPSDPWVYLGRVTMDECGRVLHIENCPCRRTVVSFSHVFLACDREMKCHQFSAPVHTDAHNVLKMHITCDNVPSGVTVDFGPDITTSVEFKSAHLLEVTLVLSPNASREPRRAILKSPAGTTVSSPELLPLPPAKAHPAAPPQRRRGTRQNPPQTPHDET